MPEVREAESSYIIADAAVSYVVGKSGPIPLKHIEIDATDREQTRFPKHHPARDGLPYTIDASSSVKRGINKAQGYVYPEMWRTTGKRKKTGLNGCLTDLALAGISYTERALILNLGPLFLMIQWLTHTNVHFIPRSDYESTTKIVDKKVRKTLVGMALVFEEYVLTFMSSDLVFQPTWASSRNELPPSPSNFYSREWDFLPSLVQWMESRIDGNRNFLACDVIRSTNNVFLGIGVYTVIELFFLAGLSPLLTEAELFDNPSRVSHRSPVIAFKLLRPAMKDGYLAPTEQQRLGYINWLHIYAKDRCKIPVRMAELIDNYTAEVEQRMLLPERWVRYDAESLYDVFEPTFLSTALSLDHNLGHLVFGAQLWIDLGGLLSNWRDPLTAYFSEQGLLNEPSFLRPNHYSPLFLAHHDFRSQSLPHRTVYTYRNEKQIWSITPAPQNSDGLSAIKDSGNIHAIVGNERRRMLFSHIVQHTQKVAIGPLEYCGNAHRISFGRSTVVVPCYGDPNLSDYYARRDLKSRLLSTAVRGERRPSLTAAASKTLESQLDQVANSRARKQAREPDDDKENIHSEGTAKKMKKRRIIDPVRQLNADQRFNINSRLMRLDATSDGTVGTRRYGAYINFTELSLHETGRN
ncbi:hypothetical protein B0H13DRAFT_2491520 [Mycena leptocephala]|nr:hypothetical protein B0H13DRAFT_2491520 [Mycena leptocephala]